MPAQIITPEDLQAFKQELLGEIKKILRTQSPGTTGSRKWLKSGEVRRLLGISPGTLQNLRLNGTLPFSKVGGVIYYNEDDIYQMLRENAKAKQE